MDSPLAIEMQRGPGETKPSLATLTHAVIDLHKERAAVIADLGTRPGWWRPFARARWDRERREIGEHYLYLAKGLALNAGAQVSDLAMEHVWL